MTYLAKEVNAYLAETKLLADELNESTGLSWLWALLFGPIWALTIGSGKYAGIMLLVWILTLGFGWITWPFFAYAAHRDVASKKAELMMAARR